MTHEQLMAQDISESVREAIADNLIRHRLRIIEEKQSRFEKFLDAFDDFMKNI